MKQIKNRDRVSTTEAKEDGLDKDDLELVDHIFDTLEIDSDGRVDIEKVLIEFHTCSPVKICFTETIQYIFMKIGFQIIQKILTPIRALF